ALGLLVLAGLFGIFGTEAPGYQARLVELLAVTAGAGLLSGILLLLGRRTAEEATNADRVEAGGTLFLGAMLTLLGVGIGGAGVVMLSDFFTASAGSRHSSPGFWLQVLILLG